MASMREIKHRIRSVRSTQQITRAMNMVAASKLQRARGKLDSLRPFVGETIRITRDVSARISDRGNPYIRQRPVNNTLVIVISGDRGLCGGYNVNVSKAALALVNDKPGEQMITIGTKARDYFNRRRKEIIRTYSGISENPFYEDASDIGLLAVDLYDSGEVDEVYLVYTEFLSIVNAQPKTLKLLPLPAEPEQGARGGLFDFEPGEGAFLSYIVPRYVSTAVYGAMVESAACEQGARMTSMDSATKNSSDLINKLALQYNRARQDAITQELTEIVSGANAI